MSYCIQKLNSLELMNTKTKKKKKTKKNLIDNLHFLLNNILTRLFKELNIYIYI